MWPDEITVKVHPIHRWGLTSWALLPCPWKILVWGASYQILQHCVPTFLKPSFPTQNSRENGCYFCSEHSWVGLGGPGLQVKGGTGGRGGGEKLQAYENPLLAHLQAIYMNKIPFWRPACEEFSNRTTKLKWSISLSLSQTHTFFPLSSPPFCNFLTVIL